MLLFLYQKADIIKRPPQSVEKVLCRGRCLHQPLLTPVAISERNLCF